MAVDPAGGAPGLTLGGAAAILPLAGIVTGATVIALAAAERPSFLAPPTLHGDAAWLAGPLGGRWSSLTSVVGSLRWDVTLVLIAMVVCWVLAVATVKHLTPVAIAVTAAIVVLTLAPPFSLTDTFNYLHYGRMMPLYGLDPYTSLPIQAQRRSRLRRTRRGTTCRARTARCSRSTPSCWRCFALPVAYWILKVSVALAALAVAALTVALAKKLGRDPAKALAFVMLNPLVLVYGIGGVHNDVFFMALLLAGALLITSDREILGGGTLAAAAAVKLSAGLAIPILIAGSKHRVKAVIGVAIGGAFVLAATWLAFHGHLPNDSTQEKLVASLSLPNLAGIALGHGGLDAQLSGRARGRARPHDRSRSRPGPTRRAAGRTPPPGRSPC